jgi:DnaJ-class molecular chaperone
MAVALSEVLALGALSKTPFNCPYSHAYRHPRECPCRGTKRVKTCSRCDGAGWHNGDCCHQCGGVGVLSVPPEPNPKTPAQGALL